MSLGWNCHSAVFGVDNEIRSTAQNGYKTCVFDIICSNYQGMIEAIRDDFKYMILDVDKQLVYDHLIIMKIDKEDPETIRNQLIFF